MPAKTHLPRQFFTFTIMVSVLAALAGHLKPVSAATSRFASPTGINSGDCTYTAPCNLQRAVQVTIEGQFVYAATGIYESTSDQVVFIDRSLRLYGGWDGISQNFVPDPVEYPTTLDGSNTDNHRVVNVVLEPAEEVTISGFTIRDGDATGQTTDCFYSDSAGCGGGILVTGGSVIIENNIIVDNVAATATDITHTRGYGGGINLQNVVSGTIRDNTISSNDALSAVTGAAGSNGIGGGIYITDYVETGEFSITGNEIYGNNAVTTAFNGLGDGLYMLYGIGEISDNDFHDNNSNLTEQASTFFATHSDLTISDNQITQNHGVAALYLLDFKGSVDSNVIINPDAWYGVTLESNIYPRFSYVCNNIIAQHASTDVNISGSVANPVATRFHHNTVDGAPYGIFVYQYATVEVLNSIISHHGTGIHQGSSTNTIGVDSTLFHGNITADIDGVYDASSLFYGDPYYMDSSNGDYRIQYNSAARDVAQGIGYAVDFEDDPRPMGTSFQYDVGADEFWWKIYLPVMVNP